MSHFNVEASNQQKALIVSLLRENEFDTARLSLLHTRIPHCPREHVGLSVDFWLDSLTAKDAKAVISWLKEQIS